MRGKRPVLLLAPLSGTWLHAVASRHLWPPLPQEYTIRTSPAERECAPTLGPDGRGLKGNASAAKNVSFRSSRSRRFIKSTCTVLRLSGGQGADEESECGSEDDGGTRGNVQLVGDEETSGYEHCPTED